MADVGSQNATGKKKSKEEGCKGFWVRLGAEWHLLSTILILTPGIETEMSLP